MNVKELHEGRPVSQASSVYACVCLSIGGEKIRERGVCVHAGEDLCLCICESVYVSETW